MKRRGIDRQKQKTFYGQKESKQCKANSSISKAHCKDRGLAHREESMLVGCGQKIKITATAAEEYY